MDKNQFAKYIAENMNISQKQAGVLIEVFTSNLAGALFEGHPISLDGFGAFIPTTKMKSQNKFNKDEASEYSKISDIAFVSSKTLKRIA